jgi:hypothetical protein
MRFWCHTGASPDDKQDADVTLREAMERFSDELRSAKIEDLVLMWASMILRVDAILMLSNRTSNHSYRALHTTVRGYSSTGFLRFTCHLEHDPATDVAWVYQVKRGRTDVTTISKYGAKVVTMVLKKEPTNNISSLELERVIGMFFSPVSLIRDPIYSIVERPHSMLFELHPVPGMFFFCVIPLAQYLYNRIYPSQIAAVFRLPNLTLSIF